MEQPDQSIDRPGMRATDQRHINDFSLAQLHVSVVAQDANLAHAAKIRHREAMFSDRVLSRARHGGGFKVGQRGPASLLMPIPPYKRGGKGRYMSRRVGRTYVNTNMQPEHYYQRTTRKRLYVSPVKVRLLGADTMATASSCVLNSTYRAILLSANFRRAVQCYFYHIRGSQSLFSDPPVNRNC